MSLSSFHVLDYAAGLTMHNYQISISKFQTIYGDHLSGLEATTYSLVILWTLEGYQK